MQLQINGKTVQVDADPTMIAHGPLLDELSLLFTSEDEAYLFKS